MPRTGSGVYQRGKTWTWRVQFCDDGERWGLSGTAGTAAEAKTARARAIREGQAMRHRDTRPDASMTLAAYLDRWLTAQSGTLRPASIAAYRAHVKRLSKLPIATRPLRSLTETDYRRAVTDLRENASYATLSKRLQVLAAAVESAKQEGLVADNPVARIRLSRTTPKFRATPWDASTAARFLADRRQAGDPLYPAWHLALVTGLRRGELLGLRWEDLDLRNGVLHVTRQRTYALGAIQEGPPKTSASDASIRLDPDTVALLASVTRVSEYVVTDPTDGPWFPATFLRAFRRACAESGSPCIRFHDLRHTCASMLAAAGIPLAQAKQRLRHWSEVMTAAYTHSYDVDAQHAADVLGALLRQTEAPAPLRLVSG